MTVSEPKANGYDAFFSTKTPEQVRDIFLDRKRDINTRFSAMNFLLKTGEKAMAYKTLYHIAADRNESNECRTSALIFLDHSGVASELAESIILDTSENWYVRQTLLLGKFFKPEKIQQLVRVINNNRNEDPTFRNMTMAFAFGALANGQVFGSVKGEA